MNNKKKQLMLTVIGLVGLIAITVGVSVAFFNYTKAGSEDNTLTTGSVSFMYTEVSGIGRGIMLEDAIPMSDELGKAQVGEGKVFDFKVTGKGANNASIPYEVTARMSSDSNLDTSKVRIYLEKDNNQVLLNNYGSLDQTSRVNSNTYTEKVLYTGKIPRNSDENYTENFKLRMWLSSDAISENNTYPYNDKIFKITVNVYADGHVFTQQDYDLEQSANITSLSLGNDSALPQSSDPNYDYETSIYDDTSITVNVTPQNPDAQVTIVKTDSNFAYNEESDNNIKRLSSSRVTSQVIPLTQGDNYIKITVQPEDRTIEPTIYKLHVVSYQLMTWEKYSTTTGWGYTKVTTWTGGWSGTTYSRLADLESTFNHSNGQWCGNNTWTGPGHGNDAVLGKCFIAKSGANCGNEVYCAVAKASGYSDYTVDQYRSSNNSIIKGSTQYESVTSYDINEYPANGYKEIDGVNYWFVRQS